MKKIIYTVLICIIAIICIFGGYFLTKFKDAFVELGNDVTIDNFVRYGTNKNIDIDLSKVDKEKVGEYDVKIKYFLFNYQKKVIIRDTTPPILEVKDIYRNINYQVDVNDFIENISDKSEYTLDISKNINTSDFDDYEVTIKAEDVYHNKISKKTMLHIAWVKNEYSFEEGNILKREDLVHNKEDVNTILQSDIDKINQGNVGEYLINSTKDNRSIEIKIRKTEDKTPPELVLKNVTIYKGKKINSVNDFVKSAKDKVSKVEIEMLSIIDYEKIGEQKIEIKASDAKNNSIVKETTLKIIKDTKGPKISGLSKITVNKNSKIDYRKGVSAYDDNDGKTDFSVDSSKVNVSKYGTYYAYYTSSDKIGNKTTSKRVIMVNHDKTDTNNLVKSVASGLSNNAEAIRDYVRKNIKYNTNSGGSDPIWYGLTNKVGNCIVHAYVFDALLKNKGYSTKIIWTTDKTHYWNMVYLNGSWKHMDSTPGSRHSKYSIMNDEERFATLQGRDWNRSLWPEAK